MDKFIARAWGDGTDFIGKDVFRPKTKNAGRNGFGDMICEVSNLYHLSDNAEVLIPQKHNALNNFLTMIDMENKNFLWKVDKGSWDRLKRKSRDNKSLEEVSGRKVLPCYPDYDYVKILESRMLKTNIPKTPYITIQYTGNAKKNFHDKEKTQNRLREIEKKYGMPTFNLHKKEELGLQKIAYIIKNAELHLGIDSGMTHFAHTIKPKDKVHIVIDEERITGVAYRWINQGYKIDLV